MKLAKIGQTVKYRSYLGDEWDAQVVRAHRDGDHVDLRLLDTGNGDAVAVHRIRLCEGPKALCCVLSWLVEEPSAK